MRAGLWHIHAFRKFFLPAPDVGLVQCSPESLRDANSSTIMKINKDPYLLAPRHSAKLGSEIPDAFSVRGNQFWSKFHGGYQAISRKQKL
jgi:hypothetical protein